ncbi:MAG: glycosyltransferase [Flavobacteriales bacterium]|nr:glycosyltransferase [Flavobacteriales bacterium]
MIAYWLILLLFIPLIAHLLQIRRWWFGFTDAIHSGLNSDPESQTTPLVENKMEDISVVLPARNEATTLPRILGDLAKGSKRPAQVIIVDDASEDGMADAIQPLTQWPFPVHIMANPLRGKKAGLSAGVAAAQTPWVIQVDADVRVGPQFIDAVHQFLRREGEKNDMILLPLRLAFSSSAPPESTFHLLQALDFAAMQGWAVAAVRKSKPAMASGGAWVWRRTAFPHDGLHPEKASGDDVFSLATLIERGDGNRVGWCGLREALASAAPMSTAGQLLDQRIRWGAKSTAYPKALTEARRVAAVIAAVHIAGLALLVAHPVAGLLFWAVKALGDMTYTHGVAQAYGLFNGMGALKRWSTLALLACVHPPFIITTLLLMPFRTARWKGRKAP